MSDEPVDVYDHGTLKWFGLSWGAPVCEMATHVSTPVGKRCWGHEHMHQHRSEVIEDGDQGVTMPYRGTEGRFGTCSYHLDCWLHEIGAPFPAPQRGE